jgi:hypothetical protein
MIFIPKEFDNYHYIEDCGDINWTKNAPKKML